MTAQKLIEALRQIPAADLVDLVDSARATIEAERAEAEAARLAAEKAAEKKATTAYLVAMQQRQVAFEAEQRKAAIKRLESQPAEQQAFINNLHAVEASKGHSNGNESRND